MKFKTLMRALPVLAGLFIALAVQAETFEVKVLNRGPHGAMSYEPEFVKIAPSDRLKFLASSSGHDAVSIASMTPAGAQPFKG